MFKKPSAKLPKNKQPVKESCLKDLLVTIISINIYISQIKKFLTDLFTNCDFLFFVLHQQSLINLRKICFLDDYFCMFQDITVYNKEN